MNRYSHRPVNISYCFIFFTSIALLFDSCKIKEKIIERKKNIEYKSSSSLLSNLKKSEFNFQWLSAKFSTEVIIDSNKVSFTVSMRSRQDSAIWMSISPALGIEAARAIVTKDSIKFIDRINSAYFVGDYNYLSKLFHTELDFEMLQSLLIGNSVAFYEEEEKLRASIDQDKYLLSTIRRRKLKRALERNKEIKEPVQRIWLDPTIFKISRILINEFNVNRSFEARFDKFNLIDSLYFPNLINYEIRAEKKISISIDYSKIVRNKPVLLPFTIPEKYAPIKFKEK